jgi:5-methylthioadenosine/S-adenosylhomocysteine deaminase
MVLVRGAGEGLPVDRWLHEVMWPREAKLTPDDVRAGMRAGAAELLGNGITTSVEMYFHGQAVAEGAAEVGLRVVVTAPIIEDARLSGFGHWEEQVDEMLAMRQRWAGSDLVEVGLGPHAAWSVSDECLRRLSKVADETGMLVHIHVAEQEWEDGAVREKTGMSAPAYLESLGLLYGRALAAHGVWLSDDDIAILGRNRVSVAHCPCSNSKHASGIARVDEMLDAGIRVGIATDGPASHHRLDLFEEMRTAIRLARIRHSDAENFPPSRALWMTTAGAADAIGRTDLGRLTPGARADMVALADVSPLHPVIAEEDDPVARVVWSASPAAVQSVWVGGRNVVADGAITTIDAAEAIRELDRHAAGLL